MKMSCNTDQMTNYGIGCINFTKGDVLALTHRLMTEINKGLPDITKGDICRLESGIRLEDQEGCRPLYQTKDGLLLNGRAAFQVYTLDNIYKSMPKGSTVQIHPDLVLEIDRIILNLWREILIPQDFEIDLEIPEEAEKIKQGFPPFNAVRNFIFGE